MADTDVKFGADLADLQTALSALPGMLGSAVSSVVSQLAVLNTSSAAVSITLASIGAAAGAAALALRASLTTYANATEETRMLSSMLGIAAEEASVLRASMDDVGTSTDTYLGVIQRMSSRLRETPERFEEVGVAVRDQNGQLLDNQQILLNTITVLNGYKAGTDRNLLSQELLGRGFREINNLIRLTPGLLQENAEWAARFGQVIVNEDIAAFRAWQLETNATQDALEGFRLTLARAFIPLLTELAHNLNSVLPAAFDAFKFAVQSAAVVAEMLYVAIFSVSKLVIAFVGSLWDYATGVGAALRSLASGDFEGAADALAASFESASSRVRDAFFSIELEGRRSMQRLRDMYAGGQVVGAIDRPSGTTYTPKPDSGKIIAEWNAELQRLKDQADDILGLTLAVEADFWIQKIELAKQGSKEYDLALHNLAEVRRKMAQQEITEEESKYRNEIFLANKNITEKLEVYDRWLAMVADKYGQDSIKYRELEQQKTALLRQQLEERRALEASNIDAITNAKVAELDRERERLAGAVSMDMVSGEERIARMRVFDAQEFEIRREGLLRRLELVRDDAMQRAAIERELSALLQEHQLAAVRSQNEMLVAIRDRWVNAFSAIQSAISTSVQGMILGTTTFQKAWNNLMTSILASFIDMGVKMLIRWVATQIAMTSATTAGVAARTAAEQAGASQGVLIQAGAAIKNILNSAWEAAAGAFKAIAGIPFVGPALAVGASIAAFAAVAAMVGNIASSEGGWDVPASGGLSILHPREMVLPQELADKIRSGGVGGGDTYHFNVSAVDTAGVAEFFDKHAPSLVRTLSKSYREFGASKRR